MDDDLRKIPTFVRLSRATAQVLMQNIVLALGIKAVFLVLTFTGHATMWMAVFADMGASLLVGQRLEVVAPMSWKFILYDWYGLNVALFQAINAGTPATLGPLAWFFSLVGNYWTAPLMLLGLWWWSKSAANPGCADAVRHRLIVLVPLSCWPCWPPLS